MWNELKLALNVRIAVAVERIWIMVARAGMHHALCETGTTFGFEVLPSAVGRQ
jgi:ribosomal protein RSM22 (predicted rRNA methylase)